MTRIKMEIKLQMKEQRVAHWEKYGVIQSRERGFDTNMLREVSI